MTGDRTGSFSLAGGMTGRPAWLCVLLGAVLIMAGVAVLADLALVAAVSAVFVGWIAVAVGTFEIVHAFWMHGAGRLLWRALLGALYVAVGIVLLTQPGSGALILTYAVGLLLLLSGLVRIRLGAGYPSAPGRIMLLSGLFGVVAGLSILAGFPRTTLWLLALLLGVDLIAHGTAWLSFVWTPFSDSDRDARGA